MKLIQLHDKLVREINKKLGKMSVIKDIEKDTGLTSVSNDFFGHFIKVGEATLSLVYLYEDEDTPTYSIVSVRDSSSDIEYFEYLTEDETADKDKDIYTKDDYEYALEIINDVIDNIKSDESLGLDDENEDDEDLDYEEY